MPSIMITETNIKQYTFLFTIKNLIVFMKMPSTHWKN